MPTQTVVVPVFLNTQSRIPLFPHTFEERIELANELRVFGTFEEYIEHIHNCDFRLQYHNGWIVSIIEYDEKTDSIMGDATPIHERLTVRMMFLMGRIFDLRIEGTCYALYGSNIKIYIPNGNQSYKPDMAIAVEPAQYIEHKLKKLAITSLINPHIIVEILTNGTRNFDINEKLPNYKIIESVQQIIYVESTETLISTYIRISENEWRNIDFKNIDDKLPIVGEKAVSLKEIYGGLPEFQK